MRLRDKIEVLVKPIIEAMGYELWGVELQQSGKQTVLRIYIDAPFGGERSGVNIDDCGVVSQQISALFDVENPVSGSYTLEVSSPGIERLLFTPEQYQRYIGSMVQVILHAPRDGKRKFTGKISAVSAGVVNVQTSEAVFKFDINEISRAKIVVSGSK